MFKEILSSENVTLCLLVLQFVSAIIGSIYFYKYRNTFLKFFLVILWYTAINDFVSSYFVRLFNGNNVILYNIYQILVFSYILLLYKSSLSKWKNKRWINPFVFLYLFSVVIMSFFISFRFDYFIIPFIVGAVFIIVSVILYFSELLNSDRIIDINTTLMFWISMAMLIYYVPSIPFYVVRNYYVQSSTIPIVYYLNYFLIFVVNILYIAGFIWSGKEQKP